LTALNDITGLSLSLHPHWKHVVILLWLNIGAESRNAWRMGDRGYSAFAAISGLFISLIAGVASGLFDVGDMWSNVFVALFPMLGYLLWAFGALAYHGFNIGKEYNIRPLSSLGRKYWWMAFSGGATYSLLRFGVGLAIIVAATGWSQLTGSRVTGLAMLGAWVVFLAMYWIVTGVVQARDERAKAFDNADFQHGWIMITAIAGAVGLLSLGTAGV